MPALLLPSFSHPERAREGSQECPICDSAAENPALPAKQYKKFYE
jgi:hypothetical protein